MSVGAGAAAGLACVLALVIAGCMPGPIATGPTPAVASPDVSGPGPTPAGMTDTPPVARLLGGDPGGPGVPGAEGSFSWGRSGSDAPWIVPDAAARGTGPWAVGFDPPLLARRWTAAWAPLRGGVAGDPATRAEGPGPPIVIDPPAGAGRWSLRVEAWFGMDRHASWFWTVDVQP